MSHPSQTLPSVLISLLGRFELRVGGREVATIPRKARALLAYLAMQNGKSVPREAVADLLWTDRGAEQARHSLRQTLLILRRELRDAGGEVICNDDRTLSFIPGMVATDTDRLRRLAVSHDADDLAEAAQLCTRPFLDGLPAIAAEFDDWLAQIRARMTETAADVLERLIGIYLSAGSADEAVRAAERMLALDPLREDLHRRLMSVYANVGRRSEAIRQYNTCVDMLRRELGVTPAPETEAIVQRIKVGDEAILAEPLSALDSHWRMVFAEPSAGPPRLAVLPFLQFEGDPVQSHLADGLVADIVCQLAGLRELSVISHGSTLSLRGPTIDPQETGRRLGARYLVRGGMRRAGSRVRLTTELTETETGEVVWARSYDTQANLSFADQDRIVAQTVNTLAPRVRETELRRIRGKRPENLSVYEKVLLAREHITMLRREGFIEAKTLLDEVIAEEPRYGEAYALAADWHGLVVSQGWSDNRAEDIAHVERLARQALTHDADNIRALVFYGHRRSLMHRDYPTALQLFERALEAAPSSVQAWLWSSYTFSYLGETEEAVRRATRALELSPCDREAYSFFGALCVAHYTAGNYDAAVEWGQRALAEGTVLRTTAAWVAASLVAVGRLQEAREIATRMILEWPERRVREVVANHPYRDPIQRSSYGKHLLEAGFPE